MSPVSADLPAGAVGSLLTALDVATDDLSASLARASASVSGGAVVTPDPLPGVTAVTRAKNAEKVSCSVAILQV